MFRTIKLPIILSDEDKFFIQDVQRQTSAMTRFAFNRFQEGLTEKDIRFLSKDLKSIEDLNSWLIQCSIRDAKAMFVRFGAKSVCFGGKWLLKSLHKKLITKEQFKQKRLRPIDVQGEKQYRGNRMFDLKIQFENKVVFKLNRRKYIDIHLPKLRNNWLNALWRLEELANQKQATYSIRLTSTHIYISFDEKEKQEVKLNPKRCIGIDMNPKFIGVAVLEFDSHNEYRILTTKMFDIQQLTKKSNKASNHPISIKIHHKLQFETIEITKAILNLAKAWQVKFVHIESLEFKQGDGGCGKEANRLTKNKWLRNLFQTQLKKRLELSDMKMFNINPAYSSVIGNLQHDFVDPVNAAIEIGRRGQEVILNKTKKFYPEVWFKGLFDEQWKQTQKDTPKTWKEVSNWLKNSKLKYRVSLDECKHSSRVFSLNSKKSKTFLYCFR